MEVRLPVSESLPETVPNPKAMTFASGRREDDTEDRNQADHYEERVEDVRGQEVLGFLALLFLAGQDGHEGSGQRRLGEHVAQQVRDAERRVEGVRGMACAEEGGKNDLADEPHDPAHGRPQGEGPDVSRDVFHGQKIILKSGTQCHFPPART